MKKEVRRIEVDDNMPDNQDEYQEKHKYGCLKSILALLIAISFIAVSIPNLTYLFSGKHEFLEENQALLEDEIVQLSSPAVVSIEAYYSDNGLTEKMMLGTGFNILPTGRIVTNAHVIEGASQITIRFPNGKTYDSISYKLVEGVDLAVIEIEGDNLPFLTVNQSDPVEEGDIVTVVGNPLGFKKIAQRGLVGQSYQVPGMEVPVFNVGITLHPGNSGSPVLNDKAEVVGVIFAILEVEDEEEKSTGIALSIQALDSSVRSERE